MELNQKVFLFNTEVDLQKSDIKIYVNGNDIEASPKYCFKDIEIESDKISGYSLLQFYSVKDGNLVDREDNILTFMVKDKKIPVIKIRDPLALIAEPLEVNLQYVKDVAALLSITQIEKTVFNLSNSEKKILVDDRELEYTAKELARKEQEAKDAEELKSAEEAKAISLAKAKEKEEKDREAKAKEEEDKVPKIPTGDNIMMDKEYKILHRKLQRQGFKDHKKDDYIFFYSEEIPDGELPILILNHTGYYEKLDGSVVYDENGEIEYEFTNTDGKDMVLILKDGKIEIEKL